MSDLNVTTEIVDVPEARRRLPRVRVLAARLVELHRESVQLGDEILPDSGSDDAARARERLHAVIEEYEEKVRALNRLGAVVKDASRGLLDFYAWRGDEMVFLCWEAAEETITHWHEIEAGYAGRRPIDF